MDTAVGFAPVTGGGPEMHVVGNQRAMTFLCSWSEAGAICAFTPTRGRRLHRGVAVSVHADKSGTRHDNVAAAPRIDIGGLVQVLMSALGLRRHRASTPNIGTGGGL
jgi:hypothetical protein